MAFSHEITVLGLLLYRLYLIVNPNFQIAGRFVVQLHNTMYVQVHSSEGLNALTVKCFRRRV